MIRLSLPLVLLIQSSTGGTTSSAVKKAGAAAGEVGKRTGNRLEKVGAFFHGIYEYLVSAEFLANIIVAIIVIALGVLSYAVLARGVPLILSWRREQRRPLDAEDIARIKRQDTAITLGRNALRYVIFLVVALFVVSLFFRSTLATLGGAALLAAVVGFGAQSFLRDIIAGFSIIFEGQYNVGDFIQIHPPQGVGGIVEEFGLRVTKIRALSGEVHYVPNGMIQGVTNYISGQQRFTVEVQLRDEEAASRVVGALKEASDLYLMPPRLVGREEIDGRVRLRIRAGVLPSMEWLILENLTGRIKAAAGEENLAAEPLIYKVDQASLRRIRDLIPQDGG
ncbi:MAG: mechanosensitive ion channel family protein [Rubrobacteraceae bacterium]